MTERNILDELDAQISSDRAPRKTREQTERPKVWQPASLLPEPDQQPGYVYRWIRVASAGKSDGQNFMSKSVKAGNQSVSKSNRSLPI